MSKLNFYIWKTTGFYADGYLIYVNTSLENILNNLSNRKDRNWYFIQGIETKESTKYFEQYAISHPSIFKEQLEKKRLEILSAQKLMKECRDFHENASIEELLRKYLYHFCCGPEHQKIIDNLIDNKKSPWFLEPIIQSCDDPFNINPAD